MENECLDVVDDLELIILESFGASEVVRARCSKN